MRRSYALLLAALLPLMATAAVAQTEWVPPADSYVDVAQQPFVPGAYYAQPSLDRNSGYWVILGSVPTVDPVSWEAQGRAVRAKSAACGLEPFDDYSANFHGFVPGYNVFVVGPFETTAEATHVRDGARRCISDAYVKRGTHIGS